MPSIKDVYVSKWLKACCVTVDGESEGRVGVPGQPERLVLTIAETGIEEFENFDKSKKEKNRQVILHFKEKMSNGQPTPPLGLNKGNADKMEEISGTDDYDAWVGHRIEVYPVEQDKSDTGYALRIRKPKSGAPAGAHPTASPSVANGETPQFFGGAWATKIREKLASLGSNETKLRAELLALGMGMGDNPIENWPRSAMEHVQRVMKIIETDATEEPIPF